MSYWICKKYRYRNPSGLHTMAVIGSNLIGALQSYDWGTMIALTAIGFLLGISVLATIQSDMGYVVDAFT